MVQNTTIAQKNKDIDTYRTHDLGVVAEMADDYVGA